jgi:putative ABC transport system permease protein
MNIFEPIFLAISSLLGSKLRSFLTLLSIGIGVVAIFISGSFVEILDYVVETQVKNLGENVFVIKRMPSGGFGGNNWRKYRSRPRINLESYIQLKENLDGYALVGGYLDDDGNVAASVFRESDPVLTVCGIDENFFANFNYRVETGRGITSADMQYDAKVAVIGAEVVKRILPFGNPLGQKIRMKGQEYEVIGILEEKGAMLGNSQDNKILISIFDYDKYYKSRWESYRLSVNGLEKPLYDVIESTTGAMRTINMVEPGEKNNFEIETNDSVTEQFAGLRTTIVMIGFLVGVITLIAAGIGITNMMLITIKQRTREIGVRKAVGAKRRWILAQFVIEALTISILAGVFSIVFSIIAGKVAGNYLDFYFPISAYWIVVSIAITTIFGILAGLYPSWKASKLDPIESLRYE